jgi:hypothetical protein
VASPLDACVLERMPAATSDRAAIAIKEACIRTVESPLAESAIVQLAGAKAAFGSLPRFVSGDGNGLYVTLNNNSGYTITELTVSITNLKTKHVERYVVRRFSSPPAPGVIAMGPPSDPTILQMIRPGLSSFYFPVSETLPASTQFTDVFQWDIDAAKGFPD